MAGQMRRAAYVHLPVTARHEVVVLPFPGRAPAFVVATGGTVVTFTLPEVPDTSHVGFARRLADEASRYAAEVERRWRGLPALAQQEAAV